MKGTIGHGPFSSKGWEARSSGSVRNYQMWSHTILGNNDTHCGNPRVFHTPLTAVTVKEESQCPQQQCNWLHEFRPLFLSWHPSPQCLTHLSFMPCIPQVPTADTFTTMLLHLHPSLLSQPRAYSLLLPAGLLKWGWTSRSQLCWDTT